MILPTLTLKPGFHKNENVVQLHFIKNENLQSLLRTFTNLRWSKTMACWYLPYSKNVVHELFQLIKGKAQLDYSALNKSTSAYTLNAVIPITEKNHLSRRRQAYGGQWELGILSEVAAKKITEFKNWLRSKRYSENTVGTYYDALKTFLKYYSHKSVEEITNNDIILFNNDYILKNKFSASFQNQVVNAIKLFFSKIENKKLQPELVHRPKKPKLLPNVLSKEEIKRILNAQTNIKHKTMLSLVYSCGLRRSELLNLRLTDVDSSRNLIIIKQSKGRKDRIVPLSVKTLILMREYFEAYKPKEWLFEGQDKSSKYDESSLALVLKQAVEKCKINKPVTLHWLRHSYATHLLENGTDLRYIQEILGHSRSTTTEIYTHVSTKGIQNVISPFDTL
jgi:integrase/recombinase XerD